MELKKQVVSLELSKRLVELGVTRVGYFGWSFDYGREWLVSYLDDDFMCPAYTVAELGEMLPTDLDRWMLCVTKSQGGWMLSYEDSCYKRMDGVGIFRENEADARAKMLIWLIENDHITAVEINEK